jgi:hypothetical protein
VDKAENPDYIVKDTSTDEVFGIEITSVYMNERSVPDEHIPTHEGVVEIAYNHQQLIDYLDLLVDSVRDKIAKARRSYDTSVPLILSIYVNEYISIYIRERHLQEMVNRYPEVFDDMSPFSEIVFWSLPNNSVFSVRPN